MESKTKRTDSSKTQNNGTTISTTEPQSGTAGEKG